jgi:hypothetical protein
MIQRLRNVFIALILISLLFYAYNLWVEPKSNENHEKNTILSNVPVNYLDDSSDHIFWFMQVSLRFFKNIQESLPIIYNLFINKIIIL